MPVRRLPSNPSLDHLRYQAKDLLKLHAEADASASQRLREFHPKFRNASDQQIFAAGLKLSDAQLAIAREYGFPSWARLKSHLERPTQTNKLELPHHERIEDTVFRHGVSLIDSGDAVALREYLKQHPGATHQQVFFEGGNYFRNPTLLEFIAENPIRHGTLPANIVNIAKIILEAGVDQTAINETLGLVSTGSVPRECRVQIPLIDLLCDFGADSNSALQNAVLLDELEAAQALIERGARVTLPVAAGLGRTDDFARLLPSATSEERHLALTVASDLGHFESVKLLLDMGEDPNRYNPVGGHSHTTPLHQAAWKGHENIVRLLVERGARIDRKDILWHGTPADWAKHGGQTEIEAFLRDAEPREKQR